MAYMQGFPIIPVVPVEFRLGSAYAGEMLEFISFTFKYF
jgi:hypothetical protein